jgi:hypothetical protein
MSEYSGYQRQRAHALGAFTSVYEATAPDGRPGRFALKIFHPPPSSAIRRCYALEGWLLVAEHQQKSAKKDGAVLEILAFGRCAEGAYSITPWQEHSLEPLVETMAAKGDLLRALAECLLNALEQWGEQTGGSHRKLKASNVFFNRSGPLAGMTAVLSDPWYIDGAKTGTRVNDLTSVGAILAQIVRRRQAAAWPIEDAPEWKALGHPGKAWLAYVNYLLNPQPAAGELTMTEARRRLRSIPKDARPVRNAILIGTAAVLVVVGGITAFARFGDPQIMPLNLRKLAEAVHNPRAFRETVTEKWPLLCHAWDNWLGDLQANAPRLLRTDGLWTGPNDPLKVALTNFVARANDLLPGTVVPEAKGEKRLGALGDSPNPVVRKELLKGTVADAVDQAYGRVNNLALQFETWPRWEEMRNLLKTLDAKGKYPHAVDALRPKLPLKPGTPGYKRDIVQTLKLFNDLSLDDTGMLLLASRWGQISDLRTLMVGTPDRIQKNMPDLILDRQLTDRSSIGDFADSLAGPLEEMRRYRKEYTDPTVVVERFLKESKLQAETAAPTPEDFPRWEKELVLFSKVPPAEDPRLEATLDASVKRLPQTAGDLEADAPAGDPGGLQTLSAADFRNEFQQRNTELQNLRSRQIVRIDLPAVKDETDKLGAKFQLLEQRLEVTLTLLRPEIWLNKVAQPFGKFNETKQRWAAWQATLSGVTPAALTGVPNRPRFRQLRADERTLREWIDGLEGADGLGALTVPDIGTASAETAEALRQLEGARREQAAATAAAAVEWRAALPVTPWASASANVRAPLEAHRQWLADLPAFSTDLDRLRTLLEGGFSWNEGVSEVMDRLAPHAGLDALKDRPAEWNTEAKLLGRLVASDNRAELVAAAQSGGLSRKLTAWRRLGALTGWPAGAEDLDVDGGVVAALRDSIGRDVKDESRRNNLLGELTKETRVRWNRAARNSAGNEAQITAVFERMDRYGIGEGDLDAPALYNLKLWRLKRADWSEVDLGPLRTRRDAFVEAVRAITGVAAQPAVASFVQQLADIALIVDPNRKPTPSPRLAGWAEELIDDGLGLTATWKSDAKGAAKTVKLDFAIVQPTDDTPPFYLAKREIAVGEFLDLIAGRPKEESDAVMAELPQWTKSDAYAKPYNKPIVWRPRVDNNGSYNGIELNPTWITYPTSDVKGLLDDADLRAKTPALEQAASDKPTLRSPLQQVPPDAAKIFAEKMLGARLPTIREWQAIMKVLGTPAAGNFRGSVFQSLFNYLRAYDVAGQTITWRPNEGAFLPLVQTPGTTGRRKFVDDGKVGTGSGGTRLWVAPVDEGPVTGAFVNLTGNVWIYLYDDMAKPPQFYVAGGSALSSPDLDPTQPLKVDPAGLIGAKRVTEGFSDVGIRPAFDAPPGFRERYKLLVLVRQQKFLTW